ncbi:hypothetical protein QTO34_018310 [Cnephaeus nilssonii]|uniref:Uncharacterized protein n=1 Tax=Cnephaeus nilssonii TaxID=3371016 RepID=A0AA40HYK5_CNENI|nr:hypothetical protein QTO34_018310 [Eptesicus nilssonii]
MLKSRPPMVYLLCLFCVDFTKKYNNTIQKTSLAQHQQVKILRKPKSEMGKLMKLQGEGSSSGKATGDEAGAKGGDIDVNGLLDDVQNGAIRSPSASGENTPAIDLGHGRADPQGWLTKIKHEKSAQLMHRGRTAGKSTLAHTPCLRACSSLRRGLGRGPPPPAPLKPPLRLGQGPPAPLKLLLWLGQGLPAPIKPVPWLGQAPRGSALALLKPLLRCPQPLSTKARRPGVAQGCSRDPGCWVPTWRCPQPQEGGTQSPQPRKGGRREAQRSPPPRRVQPLCAPASRVPQSPQPPALQGRPKAQASRHPATQGQPKAQASLGCQLPSQRLRRRQTSDVVQHWRPRPATSDVSAQRLERPRRRQASDVSCPAAQGRPKVQANLRWWLPNHPEPPKAQDDSTLNNCDILNVLTPQQQRHELSVCAMAVLRHRRGLWGSELTSRRADHQKRGS